MTHNHRHHDNSKSTGLRRALGFLLCLITALTAHTTYAQVIIGGDVYGGGKMGSVESSSSDATTVTINNGSVRTVFGGGQEGEVTGNTVVEINGGNIGAEVLEGTPYGGVYGGGEGAGATVTGSTNVTINGGDNFNNVYGGGKQALLTGNAHVTLIGGQVRNNVFAGACMANIEGYALVDIKGSNAADADQLLIKAVYGGNDISGSIINNNNATPTSLGYSYKVTNGLPTTLESFVFAQATATNAFIGNVFGGGNGAYQYSGSEGNWSVTMKDLGTGTVTFADLPNKPIAPHAYLQIEGGTYGSIYGGGNEATISERTDIYFGIGMNGENYADVTPMKNIPAEALSWLDLYEGYTMNEGGTTFNMQYNAYRIFGGNNIAEMAIRPTWHLMSGMVGNIYSGGNQGRMTYKDGLFLPLTSNHIKVNNVYGGCRMADVNPGGANGNGTIAGETITYHRFKHAEGEKFKESYSATYEFTEGYAARVLVLAGKINNIYGGNDISGKVYYGTNVELRGAISGDVYGGGNGSYAYTDNADWIKSNPADADYYYEPGSNSLEALYQKRPHVEKTLLHITGIDAAAPPVYVTGGVYCGGNSATLDGDLSKLTAKFMIGQNVYINGVFLGSNGENMVKDEVLQKYANNNFSSLTLTEGGQFEEYMKGVSVNLIPEIVWEWDDNAPTKQPGESGTNSFIGVFYCGGNVGSMTTPYQMKMNFPRCLTVFERIVGGCNSANISESNYNAALEGGVTNEFTNGTSKEDNKAKVVLNVRSRLEPGKLTVTKDANGFLQEASYGLNIAQVKLENTDGEAVDIYVGANVYGGCYASGYINGDVEINIADDLISPIINKEILNRTADYVYASAMAIYGGGYGTGTEIRGNTRLNFSDKARVLLAFGGGQMGQVGNNTITGNAEVYLDKNLVLPGDDKDNLNVYRAYAGGYAGTITGNTTLNLLGGGVMRAFAGACNADIEGYATAIVGCAENYGKGLPYVSNAVLGGNDFGGQIIGSNTWDIEEDVQNKSVTSQTYVQYLSGKIGRAIYGGSYGSYDYNNKTCYPENVDGEPVTRPVSAPTLSSTFVDIASQSTNPNDIIGSDNSESILTLVAGGGRGYKGLPEYVKVDKTYVLLRGKNRTTPMAHRIYGGGNLSSVGETLVEAYSGNYSQIFGGTHGVLTEAEGDADTSYDNVASVINIYDGLENDKMDIFGAGANSGTTGKIVDEKLVGTTINLLGGTMRDVHGGAFTEGYTSVTHINVPATSTAQANALFGGGLGSEEGRPCDVGVSNITYRSADASVEAGIYGGNHTARVTKNTNIVINAPVIDSNGDLQPVYGAGLGELTVSGFTSIDLQPEAKVANVYGGGEEGKVYNHYSYYNNTGAISNFYSGTGASKHAHWETNDNADNTLIAIREGAVVTNNVYGGGKGTVAYASGKTHVQLLGGSVEGDIYGGGDAGAMPRMSSTTHGFMEGQESKQIIATYCQIDGGEVRNVFGGGFKGNTEGDTYVTIGVRGKDEFEDGVPTIQRSAYGGGEMAKVTGTATVNMWNGYIGYEYVGGDFKPLLDLKKADDNLLKQNGNLYGAGYGEGAVVMQTFVNLHGGVIRNGLYGGGEIAAVGVGATKLENEKYVLDTSKPFIAGKTNVYMYGGTVEGDVFGGGRGFSYDLTGNEVTGKQYYTDGYVFGGTNVEIYRGKIGTDASVKEGHGNVFGGGNIGYVYSAGQKYTEPTSGTMINGHYYHKGDDPYTTTKVETTANRTEDCRVHITARCMVTAEGGITINDTTYQKGEYVTTEDLNTLAFDAAQWQALDNEGLTIKNAVFAGGNVSAGSDKIYANAVTVYGNATAAVVDVFSKDFVRLGGEHIGGLYGDGNLTFVDGYRELNITNYGTDYYNLLQELEYDDYLKLSDREKDYYTLMYELKSGNPISFTYKGVTYSYEYIEDATPEIPDNTYRNLLSAWVAFNHDMMNKKWEVSGTNYKAKEAVDFQYNGTSYSYAKDAVQSKAEYEGMMAAYTALKQSEMESKWDVMGVCAITAGRMMNTVQRADFCGVFGSRLVLHGAQDRVPDVVDYTNYTINRVGEVSLNRLDRTLAGDTEPTEHGNYFGIYNVVNFLGAFTSDVEFKSAREAVNSEVVANGSLSYYDFKNNNLNSRIRNNASSDNMVALASGAYLELVKELDANGNKVYGPVTGVIQLDMINVQPGEGGGYVYAKNEHGEPHEVDEDTKAHLTLSDANQGAITHTAFTYDETVANLRLMQTSGNFVHPVKRIVDDCFPRGGYYTPGEANYSNAHYWYIRGDFYVYDQYLSAYTGAAEAYPQSVNIPLTITAGSEGKMQLVSVNPNKYAYFDGMFYKNRVLTAQDSILAGTTTYHMNDPISYWDWSQLTAMEQSFFVDETYVAICDAKIGDVEYTKGHVLLPDAYRVLLTATPTGKVEHEEGKFTTVRTDSVFRISNELSHEAGYLLTFDMTNPLAWDDYYTTLDGTSTQSVLESAYEKLSDKSGYIEAPTLLCNESGIYGQQMYDVNAIVNQAVIDKHQTLAGATTDPIKSAYQAILSQQATFERAYVVTADEIFFNYQSKDYHMNKNSFMSETMYNADALAGVRGSIDEAYVCINTIEVADKEFVMQGELISMNQYDAYVVASRNSENVFLKGKDMGNYFSPAYVCTQKGKYGGTYFQQTQNYHALQFCELPKEERNKMNVDGTRSVFSYNFDALDLFATDFDPQISLYGEPYSIPQPVNYEAKYIGSKPDDSNEIYIYNVRKYVDGVYSGKLEADTIAENAKLQREDYELILNEKSHFVPINVTKKDSTYYVVKEEYDKANIYYPVGKIISEDDYNLLTSDQKAKIDAKTFTSTGTYYYCVEEFVLSDTTKGKNLAGLDGKTILEKGEVINAETFNALPNYQVNFIISGHSPVETSTLYVARESDINNLSKDRVITVEYKYTYRESDADGGGYETFVEKHVVNIHIQFKSGLPTIGEVTPPATVLPNSVVGLSAPTVTKGAYEILGGGWEMFETLSDANEHKNGVEYKNNATPMYWYQNNYYVAYYAKTYLGKAYSTPVPFSVANYHRMGEVMNHPEYMHIDHKDVDRASKIYLDAAEYESTSIAAGKGEKNDLDYFYDLYTTTLDENKLDQRVKGGYNLEFILRSDIAPKGYSNWTPIGEEGNCFAGTLHGNGYTISGLSNSLFGRLCGSVYNLGVKGSFTSGGIANNAGDASDGYAENCWVYTTGTPEENVKAIFSDGGKIVNSYYREDNAFANGQAIKETKTDFEQGEVAYQLNHFYLNKRYSDNTSSITDNPYNYMLLDVDDNTLSITEGYYKDEHTVYEYAKKKLGYVENYYANGDYVYANGVIPTENNERYDIVTGMHYPIYPDDYIFFGQRLSYTEDTHNDWPTNIAKRTNSEGQERIVRVGEANRVYRAPAYYKSKEKKEAYFNINAAFVDAYNGTFVDHDMTAIDFTGYNDKTYSTGHQAGVFHMPILDYEGLSGISIEGLTPNLLVYADPKETQSYNKLEEYLFEPVLTYDDPNYIIGDYRNQAGFVRGHLVDLADDGTYQATHDHYLVDKKNFNAPITYQYAEDYRMWYQRIPDRFANGDGKGWDIVCLPFTVEFVTTHQKGEITHFYGNSTKMHEYWLRELNGVATENSETKATFTRPLAVTSDYYYEATNNFLYEYYYSKYNDKNTDSYQDYYKSARKYEDYAYLTAATPYIIAFPGERYYEFDMSGTFEPQNTATEIGKLDKQVVTMVSAPGTKIAVTDEEAQYRKVTKNGYTFVGTYQDNTLPAGAYLIDSDGDSFVSGAESVPFRGYLVKTSGTQAPPKRIFISGAAEEVEPMEEVTNRGLTIYGKKDAIYIESTLEYETTATIYSLSGQVISRVNVKPMTREVVTVPSRGVYIANKRKVAVL